MTDLHTQNACALFALTNTENVTRYQRQDAKKLLIEFAYGKSKLPAGFVCDYDGNITKVMR